MEQGRDRKRWRDRFLVGAALTGGVGLGVGEAPADDPFAASALPAGYMLAADRFVPSPSEDKKNQEGALCAGEMGSDRDKFIEEGRCAYTDPDKAAPEEESGSEEEGSETG
jgi:hypothetical protein